MPRRSSRRFVPMLESMEERCNLSTLPLSWHSFGPANQAQETTIPFIRQTLATNELTKQVRTMPASSFLDRPPDVGADPADRVMIWEKVQEIPSSRSVSLMDTFMNSATDELNKIPNGRHDASNGLTDPSDGDVDMGRARIAGTFGGEGRGLSGDRLSDGHPDRIDVRLDVNADVSNFGITVGPRTELSGSRDSIWIDIDAPVRRIQGQEGRLRS